MTLVKKKKSVILTNFRTVSFTANTAASVGTISFKFNKMVQVRSITAYVGIPSPVFFYGYFQDINGLDLPTIPTEGLFGFAAASNAAPSFAFSTSNQIVFENFVCGGITFQSAISSVTRAATLVQVSVEILEEYFEEEF